MGPVTDQKTNMRCHLPESIKCIFVDGVNFDMRMGESMETIRVLVALGVTDSGLRLGTGHLDS